MEDIVVNSIVLLCTFPFVICNANSINNANCTRSANCTSSSNSAHSVNFTRNANSAHIDSSTHSTNYTQTVTRVESFSNLLSLTDDVCGHVDWCTVQTQPQEPDTLIGRCCKRCACSRDCVRTYSCCPDHKLIEYFNGTIFTNVLLFQSFLEENVNLIDSLIYDTIPLETSQKEEIDIEHAGTECVRSQLNDALPNVPPGSTYSMVTTCFNVSVDQRVRFLCESAYKDILMNGTLVDFVPVQSLKTGIIYRNRHCHACTSESEAPFVVWDVLITTYANFGVLYSLPTSVEEFVSSLMSASTLQLLFEPGRELRQIHPLQLCQHVDVNTCGDRNGYQDLVTETTCQRYALPVYLMVNGTSKTYNNLACVYCGDTTELYKCRHFFKWEQSPWRYIPLVGALKTLAYDSILHSSTGSNNGTSSNILNKVFSPSCSAGHVHDNALKTCRRVYCPCGLVIYNSTCVPILQTVNAVYEISVKMSPLRDSKRDIGNALLQYMHATIESRDTFIIRSNYMYKSTNPNSQEHMVSMSFFARDPIDYTKLMSLAAVWFNGVKEVTVDDNETLSINMNIIDSYNDKYIMVDGASRKTFELSFKLDRNNNTEIRTTFKILECRFCYQMEVIPNESELLGSMIRVKRTNVYLPKKSASRMLSDSKRFALCAKHLLGQQYMMDVPDYDPAEPVQPEKDEDEDKSVRSDAKLIIAMPAFISFIVLVMCLLRFAKKHRTRSEEPVEFQIELEPIPS